MKKIDPRLRYLLSQRDAKLEVGEKVKSQRANFGERFGTPATKYAKKFDLPPTEVVQRLESLLTEDAQKLESLQTVEVLVRCVGENALEKLREIGMKTRFHIEGNDTIVSGEVELDILEKLNQLDCVAQVEASRPMVAELDISSIETRVHTVHQHNPFVRGKEVIVGIIDTGIDYTHPSFCNEDGSSRILWLWDQEDELIDPQQRVPYGKSYTNEELNEALKVSQPSEILPHLDLDGHGTHVAGIAAGNGRASDGNFRGIAPDADLVVVSFKKEKDVTLGKLVRLFEAFAYISEKAKGRPVVINLSQGMNGGGHSGETVVERGLDNLLRQPNVVVVKSAGNESHYCTHAGGKIAQGQTVELKLRGEEGNKDKDIIEVWHNSADQITIAVQPPGYDTPLQFVKSGDYKEFNTLFGNKILIYTDNEQFTSDKSTTIILSRGEAKCIQAGEWMLQLHGQRVQLGRYDAWIERALFRRDDGEQIQFTQASADPTRTITIPGTAKRVITVGSYVTRPQQYSNPCGEISSFSSRGPTRYGLQKPEIVAPGEFIVSARSEASTDEETPIRWHTMQSGTSMAAPHVTGAAALILSVRPGLTCEQVKQILIQTTRRDVSISSLPDNTWGYGKLNIEAAVECARTAKFPKVFGVRVNGTTISWQTDIPTTGTIHYHTNQGKLTLGNVLGSKEDQTLDKNHTLAFRELPPGTYYFEVVAHSEDKWWTADDNDGELYVVDIPSFRHKLSSFFKNFCRYLNLHP
ncbi:MAG: S8 family peptidase [Symploca sp. SIO2E9]|nr:S8 family peptidase [Symploca sp. SIO2E9]